MTKKKTKEEPKTDPHILEIREFCRDTAKLIITVVEPKPHVLDSQKERLKADLPELLEMIDKMPLWHGHATMTKNFLANALMLATQIDVIPSVPTANSHYPRQVAKVFRMILEAQPPEEHDKKAERLDYFHKDRKCKRCHNFIFQFDRSKNRIRPASEINPDCPTCIKWRDRLQKQRNVMQHKSDEKAAKAKAKAERGRPDPDYVKAKDKRHKDLRAGKYHGV